MTYLKLYLSEFNSNVSEIEVIYGPYREGDIPHSHASIDKAKIITLQTTVFTSERVEKEENGIGKIYKTMKKKKIAIIGLGYEFTVGKLFATKYSVVGFDINDKRILELKSGFDSTQEVENKTLQSVLKNENSDSKGFCTYQPEQIIELLHNYGTNQLIKIIDRF